MRVPMYVFLSTTCSVCILLYDLRTLGIRKPIEGSSLRETIYCSQSQCPHLTCDSLSDLRPQAFLFLFVCLFFEREVVCLSVWFFKTRFQYVALAVLELKRLACLWLWGVHHHAQLKLFLRLIYFMCMSIMQACMYCTVQYVWCQRWSEEGIRSYGTGIINGYKPLCGCWEMNLGPLQELLVLSTSDSSPAPLKNIF